MTGTSSAHVERRLHDFFDGVLQLSPAQVRALCSVDRTSTTSSLAFSLHPDRLDAVSAGRWTRRHDQLAVLAHERARQCAARLAPFGARRRLRAVLEDAALVVLSDSCRQPVLPASLRLRLEAPWRTALGVGPSARPLPVTAGAERDAVAQ